jgi:carotenoid 1,2-hydratase
MTLIVFIGSVFSPLYAWSRRRGAGDPGNHCAVNVALYERKRRWAMTERGRAAVSRSVERLAIGPSALPWDGSCSRSTSPRSQRRRRRACAGGCESIRFR